MMNAWSKTGLSVALAGVLGGLVWLTQPRAVEVAILSDQGQPLTPGLTDPLAVKALEVISFDSAAAKVRAFKVSFDGARWVIPSAANYPADAASKVAAAASAFVGLKREQVVSDQSADHAALGLVSPDDEAAVAALGDQPSAIGTRVTMRGADGAVLADLIIGRAAEGGGGSAGRVHVRDLAGAAPKRAYLTTLAGRFSTRFVDWVETDLFQSTSDQFVSVLIDRYSIDESTGRVKDGSQITLTRPPASAAPESATGRTWSLSVAPPLPATEGHAGPTVNAAKADDLLEVLTQLRLVGVRPKPANLAKILGNPSAGDRLAMTDQLSLQTRGFFLAPDGQLLANDGQLQARTEDGVIFTLWFGEAVPEGEDAASGGSVGAESKTPSSATQTGAGGGPGVSRYMMIMAGFDPKALPEPVKPEALVAADAAKAAQPEGTEPPEVASLRTAHQQALEAWRARVKAAQEKSDRLARRFADWYYVVDAGSLARLRPTLAELTAAAANPAEPPLPPAVTPAAGGPTGMGMGESGNAPK